LAGRFATLGTDDRGPSPFARIVPIAGPNLNGLAVARRLGTWFADNSRHIVTYEYQIMAEKPRRSKAKVNDALARRPREGKDRASTPDREDVRRVTTHRQGHPK
jgi:hypothetical protein